MGEEMKGINETLKKIESKIKDKSPYSFGRLIDFEKMREKSMREKEEKRGEEMLKLQRAQSKMSKIQTKITKKQEEYNRIIAFTGGILALVAIYGLIIKIIPLQNYPTSYWIINVVFLILIILCIGPLTKFIINFWKKEVFGR